MNQIAFSKNGLPLLICTQFVILLVVCMPLCSTGIIKREIQPSNTTKLIWQPIRITNDNVTSANVTVTTTTPSTTTPTEIASSTPRISRRRTTTTTSTTTTTTEKLSTQPTTEKYAESIAIDNVTVASEIDSQPVSNKSNLDDDAEVITFGDFDGVTTEEHRFDLSRYTSDYNGNDNESSTYNETHQELVNENDNENENESDQEEHQSTFIDYVHNLRDMVLTTPSSTYFDQKHKEYENDMKRYEDDNAAPIRASNSDDKKYDSDTVLNDIHGNSTEERKQSTYLNKAEVESTNYDISASEIKERSPNNSTGEKRAKFMQEGSHVNLTIPDAGEVWALASMKNVVHTKNNQGQFYNVTTEQKDPDIVNNGTLVTKQLADWAEVTKNNDFTNTSYRRTNVSQNLSRLKAQLSDYFDVLKNMNRSNSNNTDDNTVENSTVINNTNRGKVKFQSKPIITSDQDSASQENQIIAVRLTTLPPPLVVTRNYTHATQAPIYPKSSDSENKINIQQTSEPSLGVTEVVTENDDVESTIKPTETTQTVDNSQNELKTKFTNTNATALRPSVTEIDEPTTENVAAGVTTETEGTTTFFDFDESPTTNQVDEVTTLLTTIQPEENDYAQSTTVQEFPTTNKVNLETESNTEINDDDEEDHTINEQTSISTPKRPMTTEEEDLHSQSSTLQPKYTEMEKTTELRQQTTEGTHTTAELLEPTTEYKTHGENEETNHLPDPDHREEMTTSYVNPDIFKYGTVKSNEHLLDGTTQASQSADAIPEVIDDITQPQEYESTTDSNIASFDGHSLDQPDTNVIIAISVSVVGVVIVATVAGVLLIMRKRQKQLSYGQRCRPVGLDAYSLDNVSVYNSVRRKGALRMSKRSYGNAAFDDPGLKNNLLSGATLAAFAQKKNEIFEEFKELPTITARADEVPVGCEDKNRYANIVPLPESRVFLKRIGDDEKTEYINANFVKGPKDNSHYYIACQAPLESTVTDFWRMIWEQNSRVIIMATDLIENGIDQCAEYLPPSFVIDNHVTFGDFHITLKNRDVKDKYAMSMVHLKNTNTNTWREITHFWYQWPDTGVPTEQSSLIELLLEARGFLKVSTAEQIDDNENSQSNNGNLNVGNGSVDKSKSLLRTQGPLTVHCSPGTGRTGTIIACDIALRALEQPTRSVDIPQIVYFVRRGRASAVRTREQYEFIYKVANVYAVKLTGQTTEN